MDPAPDPRTRLKCCALRPDLYRCVEMDEIPELRPWVVRRGDAFDPLVFECRVCGQVWEQHLESAMHASTHVVAKAGIGSGLGPTESELAVQFEPWPTPQPPPVVLPPKSFGEKIAPWALVVGLVGGLWLLPRLGGGVGLRVLVWLLAGVTLIVGVPLLLLGLKAAGKLPPKA